MIETLEQALSKTNEVFYCNTHYIDGSKIDIFDYRLAVYSDFKAQGLNLRGLTYVDGKVYPALTKFFNVDENEDWLYKDLKNLEIDYIQEKLDGSMIMPILVNNQLYLKSKKSFKGIYIDESYKALSKNIKDFIYYCFENNLYPVFEITSFKNQIVLVYDGPKLTLLQIRDQNGDYIPYNTLLELSENFCLNTPSTYTYTLCELIELAKTIEGVEGWVVTFKNGKKAKVKTKWYMDRHHLMTDELREDYIIEKTLSGELDDILSIMQDSEKKTYVINTSTIIAHKFNKLVVEYKQLRQKYFSECEEDKKKFAMKYQKNRLFPIVAAKLENTSFRDVEEIAEESVKKYILKLTYRLEEARKWLES